MPRNFKQSTQTVDLAVDTITAHLDNGYLRLFSGQQPEDADTPLTDQKLLVEIRFGSPACWPSEGGVAVTRPFPKQTVKVKHSGRVRFFRVYRADGVTAVFDGSAGLPESDSDMTLKDDRLIAGVSRISLGAAAIRMAFRLPAE